MPEKTKHDIEQELIGYKGKYEMQVSHDSLSEELSKPELNPIRFDMMRLDHTLRGVLPGEVVVLSGWTGHGKTELMKTLVSHFAEKGYYPSVFSYEVSKLQFMKTYKKLPRFYIPKENEDNNLAWLEQRIYESKLKYENMKLVFIDHLHFLIDFAVLAGNSSLTIGVVMRKLKKIAIQHNVVIFVVAHTKKIEADNIPTQSDIRDSSFVAQEADTVLMIWRKSEKDSEGEMAVLTNAAKIGVFKNRRNSIQAVIKVHYDGEFLMEDDK